MPDFLASVEGLEPGEKVVLYELDLNPIGHAVIIRWTPSRQDGLSLWWKGYEYLSRPIRATGFKKSANDKPAEPVLTISNIDKGGYALLSSYGELLGASLTIWKTFLRYLDKDLDGNVNPEADASACYLPEIWTIEQKSDSDPTMIQFRLKSPLDFRDKKVPNRRAYRELCPRSYRSWNGASFDYAAHNACPYAGSTYYDKDNAVTVNADEDYCNLDLTGCSLRFPGQSLPTWAFPGLRRYG